LLEVERARLDRLGGRAELIEQRGDIDAVMPWRVGTEPPLGLLELALATDAIAAAGLVPGDGDVHETLEEIALGLLSRAPSVLQLLVCREELAFPDQFEPVRERVAAQRETFTSPSSTFTAYVCSWIARSNSFSPVLTSYCQPCHGQLSTGPSSRPSPSGP